MKNSNYDEWARAFPRFAALGGEPGKILRDAASNILEIPSDSTIFVEGDACQNFVMVIRGSVRVFKRSAQQRELLLYRVTDGQTCALTTACLLSDLPYPAAGESEVSVRAVAISKDKFDQCMRQSPGFRDVVFTSYGNQLLRLVGLVEGLAFDRVDERIARYLVKMAEYSPIIQVTHKDIALEVGSVRGVVSRELDRMREKGWIRKGRGYIEILNSNALSEMVLKDLAGTAGWASRV